MNKEKKAIKDAELNILNEMRKLDTNPKTLAKLKRELFKADLAYIIKHDPLDVLK